MLRHFLTLCLSASLLFTACANSDSPDNETNASENRQQAVPTSAKGTGPAQLMEGDIIFQSSNSSQAKAIEQATHSKFSHVGIVLEHNGKLEVFEAVQPVKFTPIDKWIGHGRDGHYEVKRLKDPTYLSDKASGEMHGIAAKWEGRNYDSYFQWTDDQLYCSELVWKLYDKGAGVELCPTKQFKDYDFDSQLVQQEADKRFGDKKPLEETIVAPEDIWNSDKLESVDIKL